MRSPYRINEIALQLNLSRNTVSKVLNNKPGVSAKTTETVRQYLKALEEETLQQEHVPSAAAEVSYGNIILTFYHDTSEYSSLIISGIEKKLKENGYAPVLNIIRADDKTNISIPQSLMDGSAKGVISFNIFDTHYWNRILDLSVPSVFIDTFVKPDDYINKTDIVIPENVYNTRALTLQFIAKGKRKFGFVGSPYHCYSTAQRFETVGKCLAEYGYELDESKSIYIDYSYGEDFSEALRAEVEKMSKLPDVFFCSSDIYAVYLNAVLQMKGFHVPEDVSIVGFDNIPETTRQNPPITTIDAHPERIGRIAAQRLIERIANPGRMHECTILQSDIVYRNSADLF